MDLLVYGMILCGSAIMLINIVQYARFMQNGERVSALSGNRGILLAPFVLMVLFFAGYVAIGILVKPQVLIGAILFGGSLFVYLALHLLFYVVGRVQVNERRLVTLYEELRDNLEQYTKDALAVFRVNLTRDRIEERGGTDLFAEDETAETWSGLLKERWKHLLIHPEFGEKPGLFTREGLLTEFRGGRTAAEEILVSRRRSGRVCFVRMHASLTVKPGSDDVVAFITEQDHNLEMVHDTILNKVLAEQYDMITWLVDGGYGIVVGDADRIHRGSIFPEQAEGSYAAYIRSRVAPVLRGTDEEKAGILEALSLDRVRAGLQKGEPYEVSLSCEIDGQTYYKKFSFFVVNPEADFFILLKSDMTRAQEDQIRRNRQLEEALDQAREASAAKTAFLSNMSHDIRTPMNAIIGFTGLAKGASDPALVRDYLDRIDNSSQHLLDLINDVLEMSRIESGKMELHPAPMDLRVLMKEARELFAMQMKEKSICYRVVSEEINVPRVYCDHARLSRALLNLISNACKFTPEGGEVTVTFSQEKRKGMEQQVLHDHPGHLYTIRVRDTGIGMTPEFAERVFDAFERERNSTVSGIQGTGLGMAITRRIIDLMGGEITVQTAPGKGTEFTVRLILEEAADNDTGHISGTGQTEGNKDRGPSCDLGDNFAENELFGRMRLLIVDDMAVNREIATMILGQMGFMTDTAVNGRKAVDMLASSAFCTYQGVLMDIQMPVMDGYEATRQIRALPAPYPAEVPVIAMSANAFAEDVQASLEAGMNAHVAKPIDVEVLRQTLETVLGPVCERMKEAHQDQS